MIDSKRYKLYKSGKLWVYSSILASSVLFTGVISANANIDSTNSVKSASLVSTENTDVDSWLPDKGIQNAIRSELGLSSDASFTKEDLAKVTNLSLSNITITSTEGVQYLTNLKSFSMDHVVIPNNINVPGLVSLFPNLSKVSITYSGITGNMLNGISSDSLTDIDLSHNNLTDMNFAKYVNVPNMVNLDVSNNQISDISGVTGLSNKFPNLRYWNGDNNQISDFTPLVGYKTTVNNPATGVNQTINRNISLLKPDSDNTKYNIKNIVTTANFEILGNDVTMITGKDSSFDTQSAQGYHGNETFNDFGYDYDSDSNTIPLVMSQNSELPDSLSYYFNGKFSQMSGTVNLSVSWKQIHIINSRIYTGQKWQAEDNYKLESDSPTLNDVKVSGNVDTNKPGNYNVTYSYTDDSGKTASQTATVTVVASKAGIDAKDSTLTAGPSTKWNASDNFVSATDQDGKAVDFKNIKVDGTVDTTKAGAYKVTYSYTDASGNVVSKAVTVTVKASNTDANNNQSSSNSTESKNATNSENHKQQKPAIQKVADAILPKTAAEKVGVSAIFAVVIAAITGGLIFKNRRNKQ